MATIKLHGNPINTVGNLPLQGSKAPAFSLTGKDLNDLSLGHFLGKRIILNIFPSIDTGVCAASVRKFNSEITKYDNTVVLCISKDLPFAMGRFCVAEGLENVITLSEMRDSEFGIKYGVRISDGPMAGLFARAVVLIDSKGIVQYTELVPDIVMEPDYSSALLALK